MTTTHTSKTYTSSFITHNRRESSEMDGQKRLSRLQVHGQAKVLSSCSFAEAHMAVISRRMMLSIAFQPLYL